VTLRHQQQGTRAMLFHICATVEVLHIKTGIKNIITSNRVSSVV